MEWGGWSVRSFKEWKSCLNHVNSFLPILWKVMTCKTLPNMSLSLQLLPHLPTTFSHTGLLSVSWICQAPSHQTFTAFRLFPGSYPPKFSTPHPANTYSSCRSQLKYHFLKLSFLGFPSLSSSLLFFCKTLASSLTHTHRDADRQTHIYSPVLVYAWPTLKLMKLSFRARH